MAGFELLPGPHVDDDDCSLPGLLEDNVSVDADQLGAGGHQRAKGHLQLEQTLLRGGSQAHPQLSHAWVEKAVDHILAVFAAAHEPSCPKLLEVRAGKLHADVGLLRQCLHTLLALAQELDKLQPLRARQGFADAADLLVQPILDFSHDEITV